MKKHYLAVAVAAAFAVQGVAHAQDYQMEAGVSWIDMEVLGVDETVIGVDFTYHLETVATQDRPLSEAYFLGRNSNLSASIAKYDEADVEGFGLGAEFWFEDIYAAANLADVDGDQDYEAQLGFMFADGFLGYLGFADGDSYVESSYLLGTKYVGKLGENFVNLEAELETNDGDNALTLAGDYFVTTGFSVGAMVTESDVSGADTLYGVQTRYFFTPAASVEAAYIKEGDDNAVGVRVSARF